VTVGPIPPRLVALTHDVWDDEGNPVGWQVVVWGIVLANGTTVTVPFDGPPSAAVWHRFDDARRAMDAHVVEVHPRPYAHWWREQQL
jgi:hypothetical protein